MRKLISSALVITLVLASSTRGHACSAPGTACDAEGFDVYATDVANDFYPNHDGNWGAMYQMAYGAAASECNAAASAAINEYILSVSGYTPGGMETPWWAYDYIACVEGIMV